MAVRVGMLCSSRTDAALKEWAVVCQALADGRQTLLIRKGGILEMKRGFQVEHREFWLFPTYVHQRPEDLIPEAQAGLAEAEAARPPEGRIALEFCASVSDVVLVSDLERLQGLSGLHILSRNCVASRFHYRNRPGVHVMVLRVYRRPAPVYLQNTPEYDGCVSWVELEQPLETAGCVPVLTDGEFEDRRAEVRARLTGAGRSVQA